MARIDYADRANMPDALRDQLEALPPLNIFAMMAHADHIIRPFMDLGTAFLFRGTLDPVLREMAILRVGYRSNASYETAQHEKIGRDVGMSETQIIACKSWPDADVSEDEALVLAFTDDVMANVRASNETFQPALSKFGSKGAQELTLLIGYYMMVCRFLETFEVDIEDGGAAGVNMSRAVD